MTYDEALGGDAFTAYSAAKALAEKAVWALADNHKNLDITAFCPPIVLGPFAPGFSIPTHDYSAISTTKYVHRLLTPAGIFPPFAGRSLSRISNPTLLIQHKLHRIHRCQRFGPCAR
jgi:nucleoside-diphosphate-sugar epimerase